MIEPEPLRKQDIEKIARRVAELVREVRPTDWLTMRQVCFELQLSERTVRSKLAEDDFPKGVRVGSAVRWVAQDVLDWKEDQRSESRRSE